MSGVVFASLGGVLVTALVTYLVAAKQMSGKIRTSDASDLWTESASIREDYRQRLLAAGERTVAVETRMATLERENLELVRENIKLHDKVSTLEDTIKALEDKQ